MHEWIRAIQDAVLALEEKEKQLTAMRINDATSGESPTGGDDIGSPRALASNEPTRSLAHDTASNGHMLSVEVTSTQPEAESIGVQRRAGSQLNYHIEQLPEPELDLTQSRSNWAHLDAYGMSEEEWNKLQEVRTRQWRRCKAVIHETGCV